MSTMGVRFFLLIMFNLVCFHLCNGQQVGNLLSLEDKLIPQDVPEGVKSIRVLVSKLGLFKMQPYELEAELFYDEQARLVKHVTYHIDQSIWGKLIVPSFQEYVYDESGRIIEQYREAYGGRFSSLTGYEYDLDGRLKEIVYYHPDGTIMARQTAGNVSAKLQSGRRLQNLVKYDTLENGYLASVASPKGKVLSEQRILFNNTQQVTHIITTDHQQKDVFIMKYRYDAEGKKIEESELDKKGHVVLKYSYTYSKSGFLMKTTLRGKKDQVFKSIEYEYEFY